MLNPSMPLKNKKNTYDKEQGICDCHNEAFFHKSAGIHVFISSSNHIAHIMKMQITLLTKFSYTCTHMSIYPCTYTDRHTCTHVHTHIYINHMCMFQFHKYLFIIYQLANKVGSIIMYILAFLKTDQLMTYIHICI